MSAQPYQAYKKTQISTASQGDLIIMMFDGAVRFTKQAREMILNKDFSGANDKICRTQDIVSELSSSLKMETGELAQNLYQLYDFVYQRLLQANIKKDTGTLDEALQILEELRDTWRQVVEMR